MLEGKGIRIKAIVLGVLADLGSSLIVGLVHSIVMGVPIAVEGVSPGEVGAYVQGPVVLISGMILGWACTFLGGFVAGLIAGESEILHGGIVGGTSALLGLLLSVFRPFSLPLWYDFFALTGTVPMGAVGGYLAR